MSRIFVTGGTGVLGRWVVRLLVDGGHEVRALSRSAKNRHRLEELGATPWDGDLFNSSGLLQSVKDCEVVLHLASRIPVVADFRRPSAWSENDRIRSEGTRLLVHAALASRVHTFVYPSVCFVYPSCGDSWVDANVTAVEPNSSGLSTLRAEAHVRDLNTCGRRGICLRMGVFYGPESTQTQQQLRLANWGLATVFGLADAYHSFIWIEDAARAVLAAMQSGVSGTYDVVDDEPLTNSEIVSAISESLDRRALFKIPTSVLRWTVGPEMFEVLSRSQRISNVRFKRATEWAPSVRNLRAGWSLMRQAMKGANG